MSTHIQQTLSLQPLPRKILRRGPLPDPRGTGQFFSIRSERISGPQMTNSSKQSTGGDDA